MLGAVFASPSNYRAHGTTFSKKYDFVVPRTVKWGKMRPKWYVNKRAEVTEKQQKSSEMPSRRFCVAPMMESGRKRRN
jgi:hypothetical protein